MAASAAKIIFAPVACCTAPTTKAASTGTPAAEAKAARSAPAAAKPEADSMLDGPMRTGMTTAGADTICVAAESPELGAALRAAVRLGVGEADTVPVLDEVGVCDGVLEGDGVMLPVVTALELVEALAVAVFERDCDAVALPEPLAHAVTVESMSVRVGVGTAGTDGCDVAESRMAPLGVGASAVADAAIVTVADGIAAVVMAAVRDRLALALTDA